MRGAMAPKPPGCPGGGVQDAAHSSAQSKATAHGRYSSKCRTARRSRNAPTRPVWTAPSEPGGGVAQVGPAIGDPGGVAAVDDQADGGGNPQRQRHNQPSLSQISALNPPMIAM